MWEKLISCSAVSAGLYPPCSTPHICVIFHFNILSDCLYWSIKVSNILLVGRPGGLNLWWLPWHSWTHRDWRRGELQVWVDQSYQSNLLSSSKFCLCASNHTHMHTNPSRHLQNGVWTCWSWTVAMQTRRSTRVAIPTWPMPWMPLVDPLCFLAVGQLMRKWWLRGTL